MVFKFFSQNIFVLLTFMFAQTIFLTNALDLPDHLRKHAKKMHDNCQKKTGVSEDLIHQSVNGKIPEDGTLKCYIHCFFDLIGLIDENQVIHLENIKEIMPSETHDIINNLVDKCGTQKGADACDTAFKTMVCYYVTDTHSVSAVYNFIFN